MFVLKGPSEAPNTHNSIYHRNPLQNVQPNDYRNFHQIPNSSYPLGEQMQIAPRRGQPPRPSSVAQKSGKRKHLVNSNNTYPVRKHSLQQKGVPRATSTPYPQARGQIEMSKSNCTISTSLESMMQSINNIPVMVNKFSGGNANEGGIPQLSSTSDTLTATPFANSHYIHSDAMLLPKTSHSGSRTGDSPIVYAFNNVAQNHNVCLEENPYLQPSDRVPSSSHIDQNTANSIVLGAELFVQSIGQVEKDFTRLDGVMGLDYADLSEYEVPNIILLQNKERMANLHMKHAKLTQHIENNIIPSVATGQSEEDALLDFVHSRLIGAATLFTSKT